MKDKIIEKMYEISKKPYQKFFKKNKAWEISITELSQFPEESLGFELSNFLVKNNFQIQEKLEEHDVIHVITKTGVSVTEEIGMQYYLLGNGKKSLYLYLVVLTGTLFYPLQFDYFIEQFQRGLQAHSFHHLEFQKMLTLPVTTIRETFNIK
jgi:ubiquinone biosynthesis protein Coq4